MMLAVAGGRVDLENVAYRLARTDFVTNQGRLVPNAAKSRDYQQRDANGVGRVRHCPPLPGSLRGQPLHATDKVGPDIDELLRLIKCRRPTIASIVS